MTPRRRFGVRFVVSHNTPGSVMRLTAEYGSVFVRHGIPTTVAFPAVDWWDAKVFRISQLGLRQKWKWIVKLAVEVVVRGLFRRTWCGYRYYGADRRIRATRFLLTPSARDWRDDEVTVVHPPYLLPHVVRTITNSRVKLVSPHYMNLEKALNSPHEETAAWYRHWVAQARLLSITRYTPSMTAKEAAERLGISIRRVVYNGTVDLNLFRPRAPRPQSGSLVVSLYCDPNPQKGQKEGVEAIRALKAEAPNVQLCSIGNVLPQYAKVFDRNYGYLHGQALAEAFQTSDIFVYPSLYDGFPAPPLQAMACGAAVVTTAVEGMTECGVHEDNCLLCAPGDPRALRDQIVRLIRDRGLRERLQANGRKTAEAFSVETGAGELLEFLAEIYEE